MTRTTPSHHNHKPDRENTRFTMEFDGMKKCDRSLFQISSICINDFQNDYDNPRTHTNKERNDTYKNNNA